MKLYEAVARELQESIRSGALPIGERVPSVRRFCRERRVSASTVVKAYELLESRGWIEARPRSGYFVTRPRPRFEPSKPSRPPSRSTRLDVSELVFEVLEATRERRLVPLGSAFPSPDLFPWMRLARQLGSSARQMDPWDSVQSLTPGHDELRRQIARRYLRAGIGLDLEQIVVTSGGLEALNLSLRSVTRAGDVVAIESPTFYACLQAIEAADLRALEIATDPVEGMDLGALAHALERQPVRAVWLMTTLQNPLGATMPDAKRRELVALLARHEVALIEDDVYGDLLPDSRRAPPAKAHDRRGLVLHCGSFAKTLAPGYRVGWVAAGRHAREVARRKITSTLATSLPPQLAIAQVLRQGGYDAHLERLRAALSARQAAACDAIQRHFPRDCRVSRPQGGYFLWIDCGAGVDALQVHRRALQAGIGIAPGPMFSARRAFGSCLRLNCGHPWTNEMEDAVRELGRIVRA